MLQSIKTYYHGNIRFELMLFTMDLPFGSNIIVPSEYMVYYDTDSSIISYYIVYVSFPYARKIYKKKFYSKEKALDYILNKICLNNKPL